VSAEHKDHSDFYLARETKAEWRVIRHWCWRHCPKADTPHECRIAREDYSAIRAVLRRARTEMIRPAKIRMNRMIRVTTAAAAAWAW
jgi:hypothetical protein